MSRIKFRLAAKTDVGLVRTNNEDNFQASSDLSKDQMRWINNEVCTLGDKGALIVVADGMGGMNAGEVASELAIETVREYFSPERLTADVLKTRYTIEKYMNDVIVAADAKIKAEAARNPETKGMGTTIVIGWILDGKLYVSWCGDSRAYVYNPEAGLHQISKDHSYVQGLIDKGSLTREEAFDFPDSNIITRCLSDGSTKAKPESLLKPYELCDNDIIMLCTDGLSGMIRDEEIEAIMHANEQNMDILVDELIAAACEAEGSDNITICLCQVLECGKESDPNVFLDYDKRNNGNQGGFVRTLIQGEDGGHSKSKLWLYIALACVALILIGGAIWWFCLRDKDNSKQPEDTPAAIEMKSTAQQPATEAPESDGESQAEPAPEDETEAAPVAKETPKAKEAPKPQPTRSIFDKEESPKPKEVEEDGDELTPIGNIKDAEPREVPGEIATRTYKVERGDTYFSLAKKFNTDVETLQKINSNKELKTGDTIKIPK